MKWHAPSAMTYTSNRDSCPSSCHPKEAIMCGMLSFESVTMGIPNTQNCHCHWPWPAEPYFYGIRPNRYRMVPVPWKAWTPKSTAVGLCLTNVTPAPLNWNATNTSSCLVSERLSVLKILHENLNVHGNGNRPVRRPQATVFETDSFSKIR